MNTPQEKAYQVAQWRKILSHVHGWSSDEIDAWIGRQAPQLDTPFLMHEYPGWYVADLLIPEMPPLARSSARYHQLRYEIEQVLVRADAAEPAWDEIRADIMKLIERYQ